MSTYHTIIYIITTYLYLMRNCLRFLHQCLCLWRYLVNLSIHLVKTYSGITLFRGRVQYARSHETLVINSQVLKRCVWKTGQQRKMYKQSYQEFFNINIIVITVVSSLFLINVYESTYLQECQHCIIATHLQFPRKPFRRHLFCSLLLHFMRLDSNSLNPAYV